MTSAVSEQLHLLHSGFCVAGVLVNGLLSSPFVCWFMVSMITGSQCRAAFWKGNIFSLTYLFWLDFRFCDTLFYSVFGWFEKTNQSTPQLSDMIVPGLIVTSTSNSPIRQPTIGHCLLSEPLYIIHKSNEQWDFK